MTLLHENSKGIKIIREDAVKRSKVRVLDKSGRTICTYRFNNIPFYSHPLMSWANLDCCGSWSYDEDYLLTAVQEGRKPVADIALHSLPDITATDAYDVWYNPVPTTNGSYTWHHMLIARKATLSDLFDIDDLVAAYSAQGVMIDSGQLRPDFSTPLITLFQDRFWVNPASQAELIVTGLGLGYPIESTASIIQGN